MKNIFLSGIVALGLSTGAVKSDDGFDLGDEIVMVSKL